METVEESATATNAADVTVTENVANINHDLSLLWQHIQTTCSTLNESYKRALEKHQSTFQSIKTTSKKCRDIASNCYTNASNTQQSSPSVDVIQASLEAMNFELESVVGQLESFSSERENLLVNLRQNILLRIVNSSTYVPETVFVHHGDDMSKACACVRLEGVYACLLSSGENESRNIIDNTYPLVNKFGVLLTGIQVSLSNNALAIDHVNFAVKEYADDVEKYAIYRDTMASEPVAYYDVDSIRLSEPDMNDIREFANFIDVKVMHDGLVCISLTVGPEIIDAIPNFIIVTTDQKMTINENINDEDDDDEEKDVTTDYGRSTKMFENNEIAHTVASNLSVDYCTPLTITTRKDNDNNVFAVNPTLTGLKDLVEEDNAKTVHNLACHMQETICNSYLQHSSNNPKMNSSTAADFSKYSDDSDVRIASELLVEEEANSYLAEKIYRDIAHLPGVAFTGMDEATLEQRVRCEGMRQGAYPRYCYRKSLDNFSLIHSMKSVIRNNIGNVIALPDHKTMKAKSTTESLSSTQSRKRKLDEENAVAANTNATVTVIPPSVINEPRTAFSEQAMDEMSTHYAVLLSHVNRFKHKYVRLASLVKLLAYLKKRINPTTADAFDSLILTPPVEVALDEHGIIQGSVSQLLALQSKQLYASLDCSDAGSEDEEDVNVSARMRRILDTRRRLEELLSRQHLCDILVLEQLSVLLGAIPCYSVYLHKAFAWYTKVVIRNRLVEALATQTDIADTARTIYNDIKYFLNFKVDSRLLFDRNVNDNNLESISFLIDRLNQAEYDVCSPGTKHVCLIDIYSDGSAFPLYNTALPRNCSIPMSVNSQMIAVNNYNTGNMFILNKTHLLDVAFWKDDMKLSDDYKLEGINRLLQRKDKPIAPLCTLAVNKTVNTSNEKQPGNESSSSALSPSCIVHLNPCVLEIHFANWKKIPIFTYLHNMMSFDITFKNITFKKMTRKSNMGPVGLLPSVRRNAKLKFMKNPELIFSNIQKMFLDCKMNDILMFSCETSIIQHVNKQSSIKNVIDHHLIHMVKKSHNGCKNLNNGSSNATPAGPNTDNTAADNVAEANNTDITKPEKNQAHQYLSDCFISGYGIYPFSTSLFQHYKEYMKMLLKLRTAISDLKKKSKKITAN